MSLYHMYADHNEIMKKGHELVDKFDEFAKTLKISSDHKTLQNARVIENNLNVFFWHEEHIQASHYYQDITKHIHDHMNILTAFGNFITAMELDLISSDENAYFEEKILVPFKNHFSHEDKEFMNYLKKI